MAATAIDLNMGIRYGKGPCLFSVAVDLGRVITQILLSNSHSTPSSCGPDFRIASRYICKMKVICVGGGAASFFFAAELATRYPAVKCTILEQGKQVLGKVRISGGGRCNVTHNCFDPQELAKNYPRGGDVLADAFGKFSPGDTVRWFESRGVKLKTEQDGRMFPITDDSQTIISCLIRACEKGVVQIKTSSKVKNIRLKDGGQKGFEIKLLNGDSEFADILFIGTGSSKQMWQVLEHLGHRIVSPVPSLFTFLIRDPRLTNLAGITVPNVRIKLNGLETSGPMLVTHKGLSGPAVLKMSAFGARELADCDYNTSIEIDFLPQIQFDEVRSWRDTFGKKLLGNHTLSGLPKRLHQSILNHSQLDGKRKMATLSNKDLDNFAHAVKRAEFVVLGQNRFKEEFVTAGGVDLKEIDLKTFQSKVIPNTYLAGEVLNIDAVTGGFNFQVAWTGAWLAARAVSSRLE